MTICEAQLLFKHYSLIKYCLSDLEDSHVIPGLIHKCYLAKSQSL